MTPAKQDIPRVEVSMMFRLDKIIKPWKDAGALNAAKSTSMGSGTKQRF